MLSFVLIIIQIAFFNILFRVGIILSLNVWHLRSNDKGSNELFGLATEGDCNKSSLMTARKLSTKIRLILSRNLAVKILIDLITYYLVFGLYEEKWNVQTLHDLAWTTVILSPLHVLLENDGSLQTRSFQRDVALGLACSYFHGYLEKLAPYIVDEITNSVDAVGTRVPPPTRIILVPKNGIIYDDLSEANGSIRFKLNSKTIRINDCGIYQRPYSFSFYEIDTSDVKIGCWLEYASALRILGEMKSSLGFTQTDLEEMVTMFYEALVRMISLHPIVDLHVQVVLFSGDRRGLVDAIQKGYMEAEKKRLLQSRKNLK